MALKSTPSRYGAVALTIHWLIALAILVLLALGFRAASLEGADKIGVLSAHVPLGTVVLILTLARIAWWWFADTKPPPVTATPRLQSLAARAIHILFYVTILVMAGSGLALVLLSGAGEVLRSGEGVLPDFWDFGPRGGHYVGARMMVVLMVIHIGAALYHHYVKHDATLRRMLGRT